MGRARSPDSPPAQWNPNQPFGNNPFIHIPSDIDRSPPRLVYLDLLSVLKDWRLLPQIVVPLWPCISGPLDELCPTWANAKDIVLQGFLILSQLLILLAIPFFGILLWFIPGVVHFIFIFVFLLVTQGVCRLLNGARRAECLVGVPKDRKPVNDETELWFFINGIATGSNWLQSNLNLLAETFCREIVGIHNPTKGLIFDLIECLIQRDLDYKTRDIRQGRGQLRAALASPFTKKVVLILHSQGGIEGSAILDWLLSDLSTDVVAKLEIFTFGNAARKFNNPLRHSGQAEDGANDETKGGRGDRVIKYIEHYANSRDFVANIGVLNFTSPAAQPFADGNAFFGPVFTRKGPGHLLNMHYLDTMFPLVDGVVRDEGNDFMNCDIAKKRTRVLEVNGQEPKKIKDVSRLWQYRNGRSPQD